MKDLLKPLRIDLFQFGQVAAADGDGGGLAGIVGQDDFVIPGSFLLNRFGGGVAFLRVDKIGVVNPQQVFFGETGRSCFCLP